MPPDQNAVPQKKSKSLFILLFVLVLLVLGFIFAQKLIFKQSSTETVDHSFDGIQGNIYLTMGPGSSYASNIYTYSMANGEFTSLPEGERKMRITSRVEPISKNIAYFETSFATSTSLNSPHLTSSSSPWKLVVQNFENNLRREVLSLPALIWPRLPTWSPDGNFLAYVSLNSEDTSNPNNWVTDIIETNPSGKFKSTPNQNIVGTYPLWSPDGQSIIFMRSDGVYQRVLSTGKEDKVLNVPYNGTTSAHAKMNISPDGTQFAWSLPEDPEASLRLYSVESWSPFKATLVGNLESAVDGQRFYWPTFSPDGKFLVAQRLRRTNNWTITTDARLMVYNLGNFKSKTLVTLEDFNPMMTFINDWR